MKIGSFILLALGALVAGAYYYENRKSSEELPEGRLGESDEYRVEEREEHLTLRQSSPIPRDELH